MVILGSMIVTMRTSKLPLRQLRLVIRFPLLWQIYTELVQAVYGKSPDYTREGGSIPVAITFSELLKKNVLLLPMGRGDDGAHGPNEKLDLDNYIKGSELMAMYLWELARPQ